MEDISVNLISEEKSAPRVDGLTVLFLNILLVISSIVLIVFGISIEELWMTGLSFLVLFVSVFLFFGIKTLKPNEAYVFTLFGKYYGTLKGPGIFFVNPFVIAFNPSAGKAYAVYQHDAASAQSAAGVTYSPSKVVSLKSMTLSNERQKINDQLGNPIIIGIVVIWKVTNTAKAVFNVDNFKEYLSIQCDSALRNIVRGYPYDISGDDDNEKTLRGSSQEISINLKEEIQKKVVVAGLEIIEATITNLSYAPEIASAMLQRQQASAIVDARQMIVEGAVGMVTMALAKLGDTGVVTLDDDKKAAMVSNLLVVLCGNKDAQPVVNSGSM